MGTSKVTPRRMPSQEEFACVFEALSAGVLAVDGEGRVICCNPAARDHLNLSEDDLDRAANFSDLPGMTPFVRMVEEVTRTGSAIDRSEVMLGDTALGMKEIGVSVAPLPGPDSYNGSVLLFSNMTERRRLERSADLNKQLISLGELAAGVVHQLRNPLMIITGRAELLLRLLSDPSQKEFTESILHESEIIANSISTFLRFAKPFEFRPGRCEAEHVFDWAVQRCRGYAEKKGVRILRVTPEGLEFLHLDAERCGEAVGNILLNAVDAVAEDGTVELSARQEGGTTIFRVSDDGPGVVVGDGEDVFSPFFTTKRDGTGLGLSIAQRIASQQEGLVRFENGPDGGAIFEVVVPTYHGRVD